MRHGELRGRNERGFTYIGLLALVVLIGIMLAAAGEVTQTAMQRDREADLLRVGHQYRAAIARFVMHYRRYPASLAELVGATSVEADNGTVGGAEGPPAAGGALGAPGFRALRRLYRDPMTNSTAWITVPAPDGGIMGVATASTREPLKRDGFDDADVDFDKAETYAGWLFVYQPLLARRMLRAPQPPSN